MKLVPTITELVRKLPKSLTKYIDIIEDFDDERGSGDGYFIYLKPNYLWEGETHTIHEDTIGACVAALRSVERTIFQSGTKVRFSGVLDGKNVSGAGVVQQVFRDDTHVVLVEKSAKLGRYQLSIKLPDDSLLWVPDYFCEEAD